jgi:uncharacterized protein involved in exopolysaccharide biosynthesis
VSVAPGESIVGFGSLQAWATALGFVLGALRRRWPWIAGMAVLFAAVGAGAGALLPRTYSAETRLLVKKNYVMPALAHPKRAVPVGSEAPAQSAAELVLSRESLRTILAGQRLLERWDAERAPLHRAKDHVAAWLKGSVPDEEKADAIMDLLGKRLQVAVQDDTLRVRATWGDPHTVVDIVNAAVSSFLEARRRMDIQSVADTSHILTAFTERERERVEEQLVLVADAKRQARRRPAALVEPGARSTAGAERSAEAPDPNAALRHLLRRVLDARRTRADLERQHRDKVAELEARIAERRATRTERHPEVQALQQSLARLSQAPGSLVEARALESQLSGDYAARGGTEEALSGAGALPGDASVAQVVDAAMPDAVAVAEILALAGRDDEDDVTAYRQALLKDAVATYQDLRARLANVQIEFETAQAAFAYRYSVTSPARLPKEPDSPNVALVVVGAVLAGLLAGIALALFAELRARALLSPWAVARQLGLVAAEAQS